MLPSKQAARTSRILSLAPLLAALPFLIEGMQSASALNSDEEQKSGGLASRDYDVSFHSGPGCPGIGCGVGEVQCPNGQVESPYTPFFTLSVNKMGNDVSGTWLALQGGQAGGYSDDGTLKVLLIKQDRFVAKGNWIGHVPTMSPTSQSVFLCQGTPLHNTHVMITGQCGDSSVKFVASNGIRGIFYGQVTCDAN